MKKFLCCVIAILLSISLTACVRKPTNSSDPYEKFNRAMYKAHLVVDRLIYRPVATVYNALVPNAVQRGVKNFFDNITEVPIVLNDILQGKFRYALNDLWRFIFNSTLGIGGIFDIASKMGLPKHYEDFGLTLAVYSHGTSSPYLFIPFLGPFTFRHAFGLPFDIVTSPLFYSAVIDNDYVIWGLAVIKYVNIRAELLPADKLIAAAFDPYAFIRNAYLQQRMRLVNNNVHDMSPDFVSIPVAVNDHSDDITGKKHHAASPRKIAMIKRYLASHPKKFTPERIKAILKKYLPQKKPVHAEQKKTFARRTHKIFPCQANKTHYNYPDTIIANTQRKVYNNPIKNHTKT